MNFYDFFMAPLEKYLLAGIRKKLIPLAYGKTLEIGVGTGVNLSYYDYEKTNGLIGIDIKLTKEIQRKAAGRMQLAETAAEQLPPCNFTMPAVSYFKTV